MAEGRMAMGIFMRHASMSGDLVEAAGVQERATEYVGEQGQETRGDSAAQARLNSPASRAHWDKFTIGINWWTRISRAHTTAVECVRCLVQLEP